MTRESFAYDRRTVLKTVCVSVVAGSSMAGCQGLLGGGPPVEALELEISDVRIPNIGLTSATIPVVTEVRNTHDQDNIPQPTFDFTAYMEGHEIISGRETFASLGPGDSTSKELELIAEYANVGDAIISAIEAGEFTVRLAGEVTSEGATADFQDRYTFEG